MLLTSFYFTIFLLWKIHEWQNALQNGNGGSWTANWVGENELLTFVNAPDASDSIE